MDQRLGNPSYSFPTPVPIFPWLEGTYDKTLGYVHMAWVCL